MSLQLVTFTFFFFNDTATTEIYTLSLHDALPISGSVDHTHSATVFWGKPGGANRGKTQKTRSEEHTSELQSQSNLVCRLLLEKKKNKPQPRQEPNQAHIHPIDTDRTTITPVKPNA